MLIINNLMENKAVQKFGKNMKKIRVAKKMSQGDIYRATKIERAYISNLESGKQNIKRYFKELAEQC